MMFDYQKFIEKYSCRWNPSTQRSKFQFFEKVINHLVSLDRPVRVIETGAMWTKLEDDAGAFTAIIADLIHNHTGGLLTTIDISPKAIESCKANTKKYAINMAYVTSDSVDWLKRMPAQEIKEIDLLFLDSYDLHVPDPDPSAIHHFRELLAVYDNLRDDVIVGVDDNFMPGTTVYWNWIDSNGNIMSTTEIPVNDNVVGKGRLIDRFLQEQKWNRFTNVYVGESNMFLFERNKNGNVTTTHIVEK